ncbi:alpha/beta hydrolase [Pseudonocardiaceae bacterium YIM PH 21723]|nr:alpha/beta hydrolase [Pseudonocardiaceae bacterium YIM PH 21723]
MITMSVQLTVQTSDTQLHVEDAPGGTPPMLFLNGALGTVRDWDLVIERLAGNYRAIRFDARGRGQSGASADYSLSGALEDIGRVVESTGVQKPILVGWSAGATLAVAYAVANPEQVAGLVLVDGGYPVSVLRGGERPRVPGGGLLSRLFGRSSQLSGAEAGDVLVELDQAAGELDFGALHCGAECVVAGGSPAAQREALDEVTAAHPNISVFARVDCSPDQVLQKAPDAVVSTIDAAVRQSF